MSCSKLQARLKISLVLVFSVCHLYFLLLVSTVSVELYYNYLKKKVSDQLGGGLNFILIDLVENRRYCMFYDCGRD